MNTPAPSVGSRRCSLSDWSAPLRALAMLPLLSVAALSVAASPPAPSDAQLAVKAKAALAADPRLTGLTLLVSVVDRVAVVGGPVPDANYPKRIETILRKLPGLAEVKVSCWVPMSVDPLTKMVGDRLKGDAPPAPSPSPALSLPPLVVVPRNDPAPPPDVPPLTVMAAQPAPRAVTVQRIAAPTRGGFLLDPVAPNGQPITALPMPAPVSTVTTSAYPTIPATAVPVTPVAAPTQLAALKSHNQRFAGLTVQLNAGTATITGRAAHSADAWDFADAVRKLPGVGRVVLGAVNVR